MHHLMPGEEVMTGAPDPEVWGFLYGPANEKPARAHPLGAARLHR
jgi:hypothetical protein